MEFETLKKVTAAVLGMDPEEIEYDMTFLNDLGADSLDLYQIFMGVEDELNITIPAEGLEGITTVGEAVELIEKANRA
jgi:acyl carrier protein